MIAFNIFTHFPNFRDYDCTLGLCIFDLFSPKILISREKMNFCIKARKQAIFWIILRKVHAQTKKSINRSGVRLRNPAQ